MLHAGPASTHARWLLLVCAVVGVVALLQPDAAVASWVVAHVGGVLESAHAPDALLASGRVEALVNVALFVPPAFLATFALPGARWTDVVVAGFLGSVAVELAQGLLLPARTAEAIDVVTNTAGAVLGAGLASAIRVRRTRATDHS